MANFVTSSTENKNWFQRLSKSAGGIIFGVLLFCFSFVLLFWNEGRYNISNLARIAVEINPTELTAENNSELVAVTEDLESVEEFADDLYLKPGKYLAIRREVEIYATIEKTEADGEASQKTYTTDWTYDPQNSSEFSVQPELPNLDLNIPSKTFYPDQARVGIYIFEPEETGVVGFVPLDLAAGNVDLNGTGLADGSADVKQISIVNNHIYKGSGNVTTPQIGDIRIRYEVVPEGKKVTVFGQKNGQRIDRYTDDRGRSILSLKAGDKNEAVKALQDSHTASLWIFRVFGFLIMWLGLTSIIAPLYALLDILPLLGDLAGGLIGVLTFVMTLIFTTLTILLAIFFWHLWWLGLIFVLAFIAFIGYRGYQKNLLKTSESVNTKL